MNRDHFIPFLNLQMIFIHEHNQNSEMKTMLNYYKIDTLYFNS